MEPRRSKHFLAHIPTIALLVLFAMSPWLGILFFILRAIDRDAEKKEQTNADPARDSHAEDARTAQSAASGQRSETVSDQDVPTAEQKSAKQWHKTLTTLCTIFGAIFLLVGIGDLADVMEELCWDHEIDWGELLTALAQTIGGVKNELLHGASFVDEYRGKQVPEGKKSLTARLTIGSREKTLTSAEIEEVANTVLKKLTKRFGAELRSR